MKPKHRIRESMTRWRGRGLLIRVWRSESLSAPSVDHGALMAAIPKCIRFGGSKKEIALRLLEIDRVAAVEVVGHDGDGEVWYNDWP